MYFLVLGQAVLAFSLVEDWTANNFFNNFDFFNAPDPTHGTVEYVDRAIAQQANLVSIGNNSVILSPDSTTVLNSGGRKSVRLQSKRKFRGGLFIFDASHMPVGCGTWPAFW